MKNLRELYEKERYFRKSDLSTNITDGATAELKPLETNQIYYISSLQLTIAGSDLLTNYHRFGNSVGIIAIECWTQDEMGNLIDKFSTRSISISTSEDWKRGEHFLTETIEKSTNPGTPFDEGYLGSKQYIPQFIVPRLNLGSGDSIPYWISEPILLDPNVEQIQGISWNIESSFSENRTLLDNYRIDLIYTLSSGVEQPVSLTHWQMTGPTPDLPVEVGEPSSITPPTGIDVIFGRPRTNLQSVGSKFIPFSTQNIVSIKFKIYFDRTDPQKLNPSHWDHIFDRLPIFKNISVYVKDRQIIDGSVDDKNRGRNNLGIFSSFRHLVDFGNGIKWSEENSFDGEDIAQIEFPMSMKLSNKLNEKLVVRFDGSGISFLELKIKDGRVFYEEQL